jgi:signal transduction histidine kinase
MVGFVDAYLHRGRRWLGALAIGARALITLVNFLLPHGVSYAAVTELARVQLVAGETVSVGVGTPSAWTHVDELAWIPMFAYIADAVVAASRRGDAAARYRALWVGGSVLLMLGLGLSLSALIHAGVVRLPYLVMPLFLVVLVTMGHSPTREAARAAELERQAAQQRNELAHLSRVGMLGELSGSLAHELNQPLTAILSNAQAAQMMLEDKDIDLAELRSILADIVDDDKRAGEVIRRLRAMLRKEEVPYHSLDMNEVVRDVMRIMHNDLLNRRVVPQVQLAPTLPAVHGDRIQLQQVLLNLLINGCEAMDGVERNRTILVRTQAADGGVVVWVVDSGKGIAPGDLRRIFDAFVTSKPHGTGLGLAVCRSIVDAHGGRVTARNNDGAGATVGFWLPAGRTA